MLLVFRVALAQTSSTAAGGSDTGYTLHVYQNLVQVPALVLTSGHESYRGLPAKRFEIQIDGGPKFHPTHAHLEGNDPLSLAILLDAKHGEKADLLKALEPALGRLPADILTAQDHVSVYAFDCMMVRTVQDAPASIPTLQRGVAEALASPTLHVGSVAGQRCRSPLQLWDAVASVSMQMTRLPGRRALLVLSDGEDHGSKNSADGVRQYATGLSLAIFGIRPALPPRPVAGSSQPGVLSQEASMQDGFGALCGGTGGLLIGSVSADVGVSVERVVTLLRGRYILEFPRPQNGTAGMHMIEVTTTDVSAVVRTSGVTMPVEDKAIASDSQTVRKDTSHDPVTGSHRSTVVKP